MAGSPEATAATASEACASGLLGVSPTLAALIEAGDALVCRQASAVL